MIPIGDENPSSSKPIVNYLLIFANVIVYLYESILPEAAYEKFILEYGFIPLRFLKSLSFLQFFTSMFIHENIVHLLGNMLYLYIFGDNVEDTLGHVNYLVFYLLSGIIASFAHFFSNPFSTSPAIGASGAISGVLGAYFILFPLARIRTLVTLGFFLTSIRIPAIFYLFFWFIYQLLYASFASVLGVAYWAHIGGFIGGILLIKIFPKKKKRRFPVVVVPYWI